MQLAPSELKTQLDSSGTFDRMFGRHVNGRFFLEGLTALANRPLNGPGNGHSGASHATSDGEVALSEEEAERAGPEGWRCSLPTNDFIRAAVSLTAVSQRSLT